MAESTLFRVTLPGGQTVDVDSTTSWSGSGDNPQKAAEEAVKSSTLRAAYGSEESVTVVVRLLTAAIEKGKVVLQEGYPTSRTVRLPWRELDRDEFDRLVAEALEPLPTRLHTTVTQMGYDRGSRFEEVLGHIREYVRYLEGPVRDLLKEKKK